MWGKRTRILILGMQHRKKRNKSSSASSMSTNWKEASQRKIINMQLKMQEVTRWDTWTEKKKKKKLQFHWLFPVLPRLLYIQKDIEESEELKLTDSTIAMVLQRGISPDSQSRLEKLLLGPGKIPHTLPGSTHSVFSPIWFMMCIYRGTFS